VLPSFDIAIAGGGPAGCAAAITLARQGYAVLLADAAPAQDFRVGEGLPPNAKSLLHDLGLWQPFLAAGHRVSHGTVSLWGSSEAQHGDFMRQLHGNGFQLDRPKFDAMLRAAARECGVQVHEGAYLGLDAAACAPESAGANATAPTPALPHTHTHMPAPMQQPAPAHRLLLRQGKATRPLEATWLIDASGRKATLARKLGAQRIELDQLTAFHALFAPDAGHTPDQDGRSMIEAMPNGWWYSVLLPGNKRLFAFFSDLDLIKRAELLTPEGFQAQLAQTGWMTDVCRQHGYTLCRAPQGVASNSARLDHCYGSNWLAVGDAALSFDPLSSQGIASALYGGMRAAQALHGQWQGQSGALAAWAGHLADIYAAYWQHRQQYYQMEMRWPGEAFWQRRQAGRQDSKCQIHVSDSVLPKHSDRYPAPLR
jgi:flavin-dependent dehydrogenase